jgi:hypothetical protein
MADKKKEQPTKDEVEKKRKDERDTAVKTLKLGFWDYTLPKLVTPAQYGQIAQMAEMKYQGTVSKTPSQEIYERLFAPQLLNEGGAITSPYLQNQSIAILQDAFMRITIQDALEYAGSKKSLKAEYIGKYISDLSEKQRGEIVGSCIVQTTNKKVAELLGEANKGITSNLEKILAEADKPKEKK